MYPEEIRRWDGRKWSFPVVPHCAAIDHDTQVKQVCSNTIVRHRFTESSAEIDKRGTDSCIRVEWFIRIADRVAFAAGEPPDEYMHRLCAIVIPDNCKLFSLRVVPGNLPATERTGIPALKYDSITGSNASLDNIPEERGNA
jgi:hypothetical protein